MPDREPSKRRSSKVPLVRRGILGLLLVAGALFVLLLPRATGEESELGYFELARQLDRDNVAAAEIDVAGQMVRGTLRHAVFVGESHVTRFRTVLPLQDPAPFLARLEAKQVPVTAKRGGGSWWAVLLTALPWVLIIGFWLFLSRQVRAGGERALAFGRVSARSISPERPKVTFADVAGADEAKAELEEIIAFLKDPPHFQRLGGRLPKGVLLVGPPGTGKTLLARAVAGEAGCPFFSISGSDFVEMFVGVGAARVRSLFEQGKANAPCIIFIDELDAVGRQRGAGLGGGHDEREQTLNQLLVELDGFEPNEGVILLSATNRPDVLDPALLRPGRFDRQIVVDLPDVRGREMILRVHARKIVLAPDVDLVTVARGTPGLAGADLANIVNEAALLAARRGKPQVDRQDFEDAQDKVMLGVERKSLVLTEEERRLTAYHEAGHALLNVLLPGLDPLHKVTIVPRGRALGLTSTLPKEDRRSYSKAYILGRLTMAYGGRVAEELVFGPDRVTTGSAMDFRQATDLARRMVTEFGMSDAVGPVTIGEREEAVFLGREIAARHEVSERTAQLVDREVQRIVTDAHARATDLLKRKLDQLHALAHTLLERETLTEDEVKGLLARTRSDTQPAPAAGPLAAVASA
jgi:cell division protease FtsH